MDEKMNQNTVNDLREKPLSVSVIIPTLNESGSIEKVLKDISRQKVGEILVVDGHSSDGTIELVRKLNFRLILQKGKGLGKAIETGIEYTNGDVIIIVDADGSHNPDDIPKLLGKINEGYDLVVASRYLKSPKISGLIFQDQQSCSYDDTFVRGIGNRIFTWLCRKIYKLDIHDTLMGFKAFRRDIFKKIKLIECGQEFDVEILIKAKKAGFKVGEVPVIEHKRVYGESKLSVPYHGSKVLWVIIKEIFSK